MMLKAPEATAAGAMLSILDPELRKADVTPMPAFAIRAAKSRADAGAMLEKSTTSLSFAPPSSTPSLPNSTCSAPYALAASVLARSVHRPLSFSAVRSVGPGRLLV